MSAPADTATDWRAAERASHEAKAEAIRRAIQALLDLPTELRSEFPVWTCLKKLEGARTEAEQAAERV